MGKKFKSKQTLFILGIIIAASIIVLSFRELGFQFNPEEAARFIRSIGVIAPVVYTGIVAINVIIPPFTHLPFTFVFLEIFGFWITYFLLIGGNLLGGAIAFLISRRFGRPVVERLVGEKNMRKIDDLTEIVGWQTLLILRLFAGVLFDYVSYAAGLTSMRLSLFVVITGLAVLPGTALFLYALKRSFLFLPLWLVFAYILTSLSLAFLYWRAKKVKFEKIARSRKNFNA